MTQVVRWSGHAARLQWSGIERVVFGVASASVDCSNSDFTAAPIRCELNGTRSVAAGKYGSITGNRPVVRSSARCSTDRIVDSGIRTRILCSG